MKAIDDWFASRGWKPFAFQREVWTAYLAGESGLVHAATGTGKTLAAWLGPVAEYLTKSRGPRAANAKREPLRVLWITPLRALVADTLEALQAPVSDLGIPWTLEARTGDTPPAARARQDRRLPSALVTTPESLSLLISRADSASALGTVRAIIVDEWHELLGSKRGVQVELALARIRSMAPTVRVWGLSATIGNLDQAQHALLGGGRAGRIVRGVEPKRVVIDALIPPVIERFPWAGHLNTRMLPQVIAAIEEGETALIFCNTRSQVEIWYQAILAERGDWAGSIAVHHGSLDRKTRDWVEAGLRAGTLRCVIATSSLDLGVDFSPVDRVLQIGSPKGVARLLQRAGRSGHRPGAVSRVSCVPTNALELLEVAAVRDAVETREVEARQPVERPLDVLTQHVVTVALGQGFDPDELLAEVRDTHAFRDLTDDEWRWVLGFLTNDGGALRAYPEYSRIESASGRFVVTNAQIAKRHRMSIGTIVSDAQIVVQFLRGATIGSVEESFVARLRPGDRFVFGGRPLEFVRVRDMRAWVRRAPSVKGAIPRWMGTRLPMSRLLAAKLRNRLGEAADGVFRGAEMEALRPLLNVQRKWSAIPRPDEILIERLKTRQGWHLFIYPFEGRLVHEGLAALFAFRLSRLRPITFSMASNDYGLELLSADEPPLEDALGAGLLSSENLVEDVLGSLNAAEMARRQFREIARVAGLVFPGFPRSGKTARQLQASSGLFFDVFQRYDPGNLLMEQAHREVLERQLEHSRMGVALRRLAASRVVIASPKRASPLSFPLVVDTNRDKVSSESLGDRVRKMQLALERAAG
jgi:ATP-dependent Lhr-like helicase